MFRTSNVTKDSAELATTILIRKANYYYYFLQQPHQVYYITHIDHNSHAQFVTQLIDLSSNGSFEEPSLRSLKLKRHIACPHQFNHKAQKQFNMKPSSHCVD